MTVLVAALVGVMSPALLGGHLARLSRISLRGIPVLLTAFLAQTAVLEVASGPHRMLSGVHVASYAVAAWFVMRNRRVPGVVAVGVGTVLNGVTIAVNGGTLPASPHALALAGLADQGGFVNSGALAHPRLAFLGDVFAVPAGWPLANVFSVGDLVIVAGVTYASLRVCGTRWSTPWPVPREHRPPEHRPPEHRPRARHIAVRRHLRHTGSRHGGSGIRQSLP